MQKEKDIDGLLNFWKEKFKKQYFELQHPEYPEITSRAVYNIQYDWTNYIFMIDKDNKEPWIIAQCFNLVDLVITKRVILNISPTILHPFNTMENLSKLNSGLLEYSDKKFGFLLGHTRPYHFFYDCFKYLYEFNRNNKFYRNKSISQNTSFYKYKNKKTEKNTVFIFSCALNNNYLSQQNNPKIKQLNEQMEKFVYEDSMKTFKKTTHSSNTLILWYGITGQKRSWLEQIEGCENIVLKLLEYYPKIELIIDGMTGTEGKILKNKDDEEVYNQIAKKLEGKCKITSLIGRDYKHKIQVCSAIDLFIANAGTGCMVPLRFCKKPGILHSNSSLYTFPDTYADTVKFHDKKYQIDVIDAQKKDSQFQSYHIPWQHIFNLTAELINHIKSKNIKPLDVPSVEKMASEYELYEQEKNKFKIPFKELESIIKPSFGSADILRIVSLAFEKSGDINTARTIMNKAHKLRPNGPFIKQKLNEYKKILGDINESNKIKERENNKFKIPFEKLKTIIKPNFQSPDILREVALTFEESGDIITARAIMQKAHELRSEGPFIKQKLDEYTDILKKLEN
jgi:tetratricopeptide (TPR) repeat protein